MSRALTCLVVLAALASTACQATGTGQATVSVVPKPGGTDKAKEAGRRVELQVNAPASLVAAGAGNIVNGDVNGLVAAGGGNLVAAGAGNLVAAGGGNLVAAGAGNLRAPGFRLQEAAVDTYKPVEKAVVMFKALNAAGEVIDKTAAVTDANGRIKFTNVKDGSIMAVALFKVGDKTYEMAAPVAKGDQAEPTMVDPINTFVAARIRSILQANKIATAELALDDLKMVWTHFNDAKITPDTTALTRGTSIEDLNKFYMDNIGKLPQAGQDAVKAYMAKIAAAAK